MNTTPSRELSARDALTVEISTVFLASIMTGYKTQGNALSHRVDDSLHQAERYRAVCVAAARNLVEANELDHPEENSNLRLRAVASLMGSTVTGLVARGEDPAKALIESARMRDRFFITAKALIEVQIEMANRPAVSDQAPFVAVPRDMEAWRNKREGLSLEPMAETSTAEPVRPKAKVG